MNTEQKKGLKSWRLKIHEIIFEADTPAGKLFDLALLLFIVSSIVAVMLESVADIGTRYGRALRTIEWAFTLLFMIEYALRIISLRRPRHYILSFYGIIDLLSFLPSFVGLVFT